MPSEDSLKIDKHVPKVDTTNEIPEPLKERNLRRTVLSISTVIFFIQFMVLIVEANTLYSRGELTIDYAVFAPAVSSISHLLMNPHVSLPDGIQSAPYIQNHFEWVTWPISLIFGWLLRFPTWVILLVICQALPTALVGLLASVYAYGEAERHNLASRQTLIVSLTPPLLALTDIWLYWDSRFDFHYQALQGFLALLIIFALDRRRLGVAFILSLVLSGTGETAAIIFLPIVMFLVVRSRWTEAGVAAIWMGFTVFEPGLFRVPTQVGANFASAFSYLKARGHAPTSAIQVAGAFFQDPRAVVNQIWANRLDIWSEVTAAGFLGLFSPVALVVVGSLGFLLWSGSVVNFSVPTFQTIAISQFTIFFSGPILMKVFQKTKSLGFVISAFMIVWSTGWLVAFAPTLIEQIITTSSTAIGAEIQNLNSEIPQSTIVMTPNAILGDFPNHQVRALGCPPGKFTFPNSKVAVVVDPWKGIQVCGPYEILQVISRISSLPGAQVIGPNASGLYVINLNASNLSSRTIYISNHQALTAQFLISPDASHGRFVKAGATGVIESALNQQYVIEGITADLKPQSAGEVTVDMAVQGVAQIQVWNDASGRLLAEASLPTTKREQVSLNFETGRFIIPPSFTQGYAIFQTHLIPPLILNPIEIRIVSQGQSEVRLYGLKIPTL